MIFLTTVLATLFQTLQINDQTLSVEVAKTTEEKEKGLMGRTSLKANQGMLFVYEKPTILTFWMKNTYIPLSIGFFNESKELIDIQDMPPPQNDLAPLIIYKSGGPAQYALEVPLGWFQKHKIQPGAKFSLQ